MRALPEFDALIAPISEAEPCGTSLEDTVLLASFDAFRVFGRTPIKPEPKSTNPDPKKPADKAAEPPPYRTVRSEAVAALATSKDLRLLAHLAAATLRTDGLAAFLDTVVVAATWLERWWSATFPLVDEDAIQRRNALNCFSDDVAMIDGVRRAPLVASREHGRISLRDVEMATGVVAVGEGDTPPDTGLIAAAFAAVPVDALRALLEAVEAAGAALTAIDAKMRAEAGVEAGPNLDPLAAQLAKVVHTLRVQLAARGGAEGASDGMEGGGEGHTGAVDTPSGAPVGAVRSRQDAIRALDAVAAFFRHAEPSSPVPFFLERAKRLVAKDFMEVLNDVAPGALSAAREAVGLRDQQG